MMGASRTAGSSELNKTLYSEHEMRLKDVKNIINDILDIIFVLKYCIVGSSKVIIDESYFNIILIFFIWKKLEINIFGLQSFIFVVSGNSFWQIRRKMELFYDKLCSLWLEHKLAWILDQLVGRSQATDALYLEDVQKSMVIFVHFINFLISFKTL